DPSACCHTMRLLSGEATALVDFGRPFLKAMAMAMGRVMQDTAATRQWRHMVHVMGYCGARLQQLMASLLPGATRPASRASIRLLRARAGAQRSAARCAGIRRLSTGEALW